MSVVETEENIEFDELFDEDFIRDRAPISLRLNESQSSMLQGMIVGGDGCSQSHVSFLGKAERVPCSEIEWDELRSQWSFPITDILSWETHFELMCLRITSDLTLLGFYGDTDIDEDENRPSLLKTMNGLIKKLPKGETISPELHSVRYCLDPFKFKLSIERDKEERVWCRLLMRVGFDVGQG